MENTVESLSVNLIFSMKVEVLECYSCMKLFIPGQFALDLFKLDDGIFTFFSNMTMNASNCPIRASTGASLSKFIKL